MKLRKVKNICLQIVSSVRLSSYKRRIQKLHNKRDKLSKRKNTDHADVQFLKYSPVLRKKCLNWPSCS